jgi:hypothetical protein
MLLNGQPLISFLPNDCMHQHILFRVYAAIQLSVRSTVSNAPFAVGDIPIERIGRLPHTVQEIVHIVGCDTESEVLRHPDRHLIIREIITKKLLEVVDVLSVPNRGPWHLRTLVAALRSRNRCRAC